MHKYQACNIIPEPNTNKCIDCLCIRFLPVSLFTTANVYNTATICK